MKNKFIVIEGACDGIGKTTQYELLKKRLIDDGEKIVYHHFPTYNTIQGKPVEEYLKGSYGKPSELSPYFINMLYAEDRAITWNTKLKKEYDNGKIIILDRYTTSSLIYQSCLIDDLDKKKEFLDYITDFEYNKLGIKKPDKVIFLEADYDVVSNMRKKRESNDGIENDIHEANEEFMYKVYENALFVAKYLKWDIIKCSKNNKMKSIEEIHEDIYKKINK